MTQQAITEAANWLATTSPAERPHPLIPHLRKAYNLTPLQAVEAIREAELTKARAH